MSEKRNAPDGDVTDDIIRGWCVSYDPTKRRELVSFARDRFGIELTGHLFNVCRALQGPLRFQIPSRHALERAVGDANVKDVRELLQMGVRPNKWSNANALRNASGNGCTEIVKLMLSVGVRQTPETSPDALSKASKNGHVDIVRLLLESGARQTRETSPRALFWASRNGHADVVKELLAFGSSISRRHHPELFWACRNGHTDIVRMLLDKGARVGLKYPLVNDLTLLKHLTLKGFSQIRDMLVAVDSNDAFWGMVGQIGPALSGQEFESVASCEEMSLAIDKLLNARDAVDPTWDGEHNWNETRIHLLNLFEDKCGRQLMDHDISTFSTFLRAEHGVFEPQQ